MVAAIVVVIVTALALAIVGYFDRVSLTFPVLFAAFIGLAAICLILRTEEAEYAGLGKRSALMLSAQSLGLPLFAWLAGIALVATVLIGSQFLALQKLMVIVAIMNVVIFLAVMTLLPAFLSLLRPLALDPADDGEEDERGHWLDGLMSQPPSRGWAALRRGLAATLIAVSVLCAMLVPAFNFESPSAVTQNGASPAEHLFRELSAREPSLLASGQILAEPGDAARNLVRRLAVLPEVEGVRWVEAFLPTGEADKRAILARLQGVFPRNTNAVEDVPDELLKTEFAKLQDGLRRIAAEPAATPDLARAANELRRSLLLLDNNGAAPVAALRQLERTFFVRLQLLLDRIDRLSRLEPLTLERLDPAIHRQYVSRDGLWRIEVQPRRPHDIETFAAALRSVTPGVAGAALIEADRLAVMRAAMPRFLGAFLLLAAILPLVLFRNFRKAARIWLPVFTTTLLGLGISGHDGHKSLSGVPCGLRAPGRLPAGCGDTGGELVRHPGPWPITGHLVTSARLAALGLPGACRLHATHPVAARGRPAIRQACACRDRLEPARLLHPAAAIAGVDGAEAPAAKGRRGRVLSQAS